MVSKIIVIVIGGIFVIIGLIMLVTPGPGIVFLALGMGIWSTKFPTIKRYMYRVKKKIKERSKK